MVDREDASLWADALVELSLKLRKVGLVLTSVTVRKAQPVPEPSGLKISTPGGYVAVLEER